MYCSSTAGVLEAVSPSCSGVTSGVDTVSAAWTAELPDSRCLLHEMILVCVRLALPAVLEGAAAVCSTCMRASETSCWASARPAMYVNIPDVSAEGTATASRPRKQL